MINNKTIISIFSFLLFFAICAQAQTKVNATQVGLNTSSTVTPPDDGSKTLKLAEVGPSIAVQNQQKGGFSNSDVPKKTIEGLGTIKVRVDSKSSGRTTNMQGVSIERQN